MKDVVFDGFLVINQVTIQTNLKLTKVFYSIWDVLVITLFGLLREIVHWGLC